MKFKQFYLDEKVELAMTKAKSIFKMVFSEAYPRFPLSAPMVKRINSDKLKRKKVWHITDLKMLKQLLSIQGSKKHISVLTDLKNPDALTRSPALFTKMNVVLLMEADVILESVEDIYTDVDKSGRRWFRPGDMMRVFQRDKYFNSKNIKLFETLLQEFTDLRNKIKFSVPDEEQDDNVVKSKMIKEYIDGVERILKKPAYIELLFTSMGKGKTEFQEQAWDEWVVNNFKIKKMYIVKEKLFEDQMKDAVLKKLSKKEQDNYYNKMTKLKIKDQNLDPNKLKKYKYELKPAEEIYKLIKKSKKG